MVGRLYYYRDVISRWVDLHITLTYSILSNSKKIDLIFLFSLYNYYNSYKFDNRVTTVTVMITISCDMEKDIEDSEEY